MQNSNNNKSDINIFWANCIIAFRWLYAHAHSTEVSNLSKHASQNGNDGVSKDGPGEDGAQGALFKLLIVVLVHQPSIKNAELEARHGYLFLNMRILNVF